MRHERALTKEKKSVIRSLSKGKMSERAITIRVNRSKTTVRNVLRTYPPVKSAKKVGWPHKRSKNTAHTIVQKAEKGLFSDRNLLDMYSALVSLRVLWARRQLRKSPSCWDRTIFSERSAFASTVQMVWRLLGRQAH
eukprot:IDg19400t1